MIGYRPAELIGQNITMVMDPRELARAEAMVNGLHPRRRTGNCIIWTSPRHVVLDEVSVERSWTPTVRPWRSGARAG